MLLSGNLSFSHLFAIVTFTENVAYILSLDKTFRYITNVRFDVLNENTNFQQFT